MSGRTRQGGFSLAETLIALGVLTVGMLLIVGVFPVGIHFTYLMIDRTTSAAVADEAFAKVRLYTQRAFDDTNEAYDRVKIEGLETDHLRDFNDWFNWYVSRPGFDDYEMHYEDFAYPSIANVNEVDKRYCWSALCRIVAPSDPNFRAPVERMVQVTVFVSKRMGPDEKYYEARHNWNIGYPSDYGEVLSWSTTNLIRWPMPVKVEVFDSSRDGNLEDNELRIDRLQEINLINGGYRVVDDATGRIYRVLERYPSPDDDIILLDKDRQGEIEDVWVIPPARMGGKSPCVAVYQKILRF